MTQSSGHPQFIGHQRNRLDAKGRVSIPALFRNELRRGDGTAEPLVLRSSHQNPCLEAWPASIFHGLASSFDRLDLFSDANDDFAAALYGGAFPVEPDREGRIVLPPPLAAHAGIDEAVFFIGMGRRFFLWEPEAGERWLFEAPARVRASGRTLPAQFS